MKKNFNFNGIVKQIFQWIMAMALFTTVSADNKKNSPDNNNAKVSSVLTLCSGVILAKSLPDNNKAQGDVVEDNEEKTSPVKYCSKDELNQQIPSPNQVYINMLNKTSYNIIQEHGASDHHQDKTIYAKTKEKTLEVYFYSRSLRKTINNNIGTAEGAHKTLIGAKKIDIPLQNTTGTPTDPLSPEMSKTTGSIAQSTKVDSQLKPLKFLKIDHKKIQSLTINGEAKDDNHTPAYGTNDGSNINNGSSIGEIPTNTQDLFKKIYTWKQMFIGLSMDTVFYGINWVQSNWLPVKDENLDGSVNTDNESPTSLGAMVPQC